MSEICYSTKKCPCNVCLFALKYILFVDCYAFFRLDYLQISVNFICYYLCFDALF